MTKASLLSLARRESLEQRQEAGAPVTYIPDQAARPTIEQVRGWLEQKDRWRKELEDELARAKAQVADIELLLLEIDSLKGA